MKKQKLNEKIEKRKKLIKNFNGEERVAVHFLIPARLFIKVKKLSDTLGVTATRLYCNSIDKGIDIIINQL